MGAKLPRGFVAEHDPRSRVTAHVDPADPDNVRVMTERDRFPFFTVPFFFVFGLAPLVRLVCSQYRMGWYCDAELEGIEVLNPWRRLGRAFEPIAVLGASAAATGLLGYEIALQHWLFLVPFVVVTTVASWSFIRGLRALSPWASDFSI